MGVKLSSFASTHTQQVAAAAATASTPVPPGGQPLEGLQEVLLQVVPGIIREVVPGIIREVVPGILREVVPGIIRTMLPEVQSEHWTYKNPVSLQIVFLCIYAHVE